MKFPQLKNEIVACIDAGISVELVSAPGRGKSEFTRDLAKYLSERDGEEWGFAVAFLATYTPPDLIGYQFKGEREFVINGEPTKLTVTDPSMPMWMITTQGKPVFAYRRGILLLDEYGQGESDVKRASAELFLNKQIGPWRLPEGWGVVACSNRSADRSGVTKAFDFVINRRAEFHVTDDIQAWTDWAISHNITPLTIAFANQHPEIVFSDGVPEKQGPWCTPRSLVMVDRYLRSKSRGGATPDDASTMEAVRGLIGDGATAQYSAFIRLEREMPKYEDIIGAPTIVKVPEKPDACMLVCYNLAHRVTSQDIGQVITYTSRMPKEFAVIFAKTAVDRDFNLINHPALQKWCSQNASVMAAIAQRSK